VTESQRIEKKGIFEESSLMKILLSILLCFIFSSGCKKDGDAVVVDLGYEYFPNRIGTYIIYEVDSTGYGINGEVNLQYEVKELLAEEFVDGENQLAVKVERYQRLDDGDAWVLSDVWTQKRTNSSAQRIEEDVRFIRLGFPVELDKTWNGNAYNTMQPWNYKITSVDVPLFYNGLTFEKTATVFQRNNVNLIEEEIASEIYAKGVGMIYKRLKDVSFQQGELIGLDMTMTIIDFGEEGE